jgi:hypothetical protein
VSSFSSLCSILYRFRRIVASLQICIKKKQAMRLSLTYLFIFTLHQRCKRTCTSYSSWTSRTQCSRWDARATRRCTSSVPWSGWKAGATRVWSLFPQSTYLGIHSAPRNAIIIFMFHNFPLFSPSDVSQISISWKAWTMLQMIMIWPNLIVWAILWRF